MIADLEPYPAMKDFGVRWLGDVPEHWEIHQLGRIGRFFKGIGGTKEDEVPSGVPCVRYGDLYMQHQYFIRESRSRVSEQRAVDYTPIQYGDVLFAGSGETIEEIGKSAVNLISRHACCGGDVIIFRSQIEVDASFLGYATDCPQAAHQKSCMGRGVTVMHIYGDELKYMWVAIPPLSEQAAIVRFLDHADRRIRRYIRAKQKLITLLEEQKQAIIHQAVTGQVDARTGQPYPTYKPSGVEWLGHVPEHWEVRRIKTLCSMKSGDGITTMSIEPTGGYPVYGGNGLRGYTSNYTHDGNFALIGRQGALCGNVHIARGQFWASEHAVVVTIHSDHVLEWFGAILGVMNLNQYSIAAAQPGLAVERVLNLWVPVPPSEEQAVIATDIEQQTAYIDVTVNRDHRQISFLREYRTRLITDVVTGKLDVRETAAGLPDEVEEPEPFDETGALIDGEEEPSDGLDATPEEAAV